MDAAEAQRLHSALQRADPLLSENTFLSNLVVQMFARCGCLRDAEAVFGAMATPNHFSRNIMIQAYSKAGDLIKARELFDRVERDGDEEAAAVARTTMLVAYANKGLAQQAKAMFDGIKRGRDVVAWTALLAASARLDEAERVFRRMPSRNVVSFNAMLVACDRGDRLDLAKAIFDGIPSGSANVLSWNTLLCALARHGRLVEARAAFNKMPARVTETWNAMVAALVAAAGTLSSGPERDVLMEEASSLFVQTPTPNVVSWTTMVTAHSQNGDLLRAKAMFDKMPLAPNVVSWTCLLHAYCTNGDLASAEELFKRRMPRRSVVAWATMLQGYATFGKLRQAKATFEVMPQHNSVAWNTMIQAYGRAGRTAEARAMFDASPVPCNEVAFTVVISMYAAAGHLDKAAELFFGQQPRNLVNWNAMVAAYAQAGRGRQAVELYRQMCAEGVEPDGVTFMSVLPACSYQGLVGTGLVELQRMEMDFGLRPTEEHYVCLVDALARSGQLAMAEELAGASIPFSSVAMASLLAASRTQKDVDRAYRIGGLAINGRVEALTSGAPYTLLASSLDEQ